MKLQNSPQKGLESSELMLQIRIKVFTEIIMRIELVSSSTWVGLKTKNI